MMTVVPARRMAPTEGKAPLRTFQYISHVPGSVEKLAGSTVAIPASAPSAAFMRCSRSRVLSARTSISRAAACSLKVRRTGGSPGLSSTERRAERSSSSTAETGCGLRRMTAWQAVSMVGKKTSALALQGSSTTVRRSDAREEAKRALRADHQVREYLDRVLVIDERVEAVAGGVLDLELVANARGQCGIGTGGGGQMLQFAQQGCMALAKGRDAERVFGVEQRAIGQHHAQTGQRAIAVLRGAAAHSGGIVCGDAPDLACTNGGRVGADLASEWGEEVVHFAADDAGAKADRGGVG